MFDLRGGILLCVISLCGAILIYLGGRIGFVLSAIPTVAWAGALVSSFVEQKVWVHEGWPMFLIPALLSLPLVTAVLSWREIGWLRAKKPTFRFEVRQ